MVQTFLESQIGYKLVTKWSQNNHNLMTLALLIHLCFISVISSRVNPLIFRCLFKSLTDKVTNSSSEIPQLILAGDIGREGGGCCSCCIIFSLLHQLRAPGKLNGSLCSQQQSCTVMMDFFQRRSIVLMMAVISTF